MLILRIPLFRCPFKSYLAASLTPFSMKFLLSFVLYIPACILFSQASDQHIIAPQGGYTRSETFTVSWTIGDLVTETIIQDQAILTQGFQQPVILVQEVASDIQNELVAKVFPNPFGNEINISILNGEKEYYVDLFDPAGNRLSRIQSKKSEEIIQLEDLPAAQYLLRISLIESESTKVFKITKSH